MAYQIKTILCAPPYLQSVELNEFVYISLLWSRNSGMKPGEGKAQMTVLLGLLPPLLSLMLQTHFKGILTPTLLWSR